MPVCSVVVLIVIITISVPILLKSTKETKRKKEFLRDMSEYFNLSKTDILAEIDIITKESPSLKCWYLDQEKQKSIEKRLKERLLK